MKIYSHTTKQRKSYTKITQQTVIEWMKGEVDSACIDKVHKAAAEVESQMAP